MCFGERRLFLTTTPTYSSLKLFLIYSDFPANFSLHILLKLFCERSMFLKIVTAKNCNNNNNKILPMFLLFLFSFNVALGLLLLFWFVLSSILMLYDKEQQSHSLPVILTYLIFVATTFKDVFKVYNFFFYLRISE